ncbi:hypothetical protein QA633_23890 [Bradyrhizobium barranii]|uniref:hypothetical protein n=1 Tax=Bradyrhizobium barranii TaxID=2992140 RepID=UPI0024AF5949|nr:hypothetical protein [Bradyrhizobium barranii]WFT91408.1 hypothetical protein QA633_23890 [Bradyrhizobium barranii]
MGNRFPFDSNPNRGADLDNLSQRALRTLASPSTPAEVREQVEDRAANGEKVTAAEIEELKPIRVGTMPAAHIPVDAPKRPQGRGGFFTESRQSVRGLDNPDESYRPHSLAGSARSPGSEGVTVE